MAADAKWAADGAGFGGVPLQSAIVTRSVDEDAGGAAELTLDSSMKNCTTTPGAKQTKREIRFGCTKTFRGRYTDIHHVTHRHIRTGDVTIDPKSLGKLSRII